MEVPAKVGIEAALIGLIVRKSVESGAKAIEALDAIGPFERSDGCAKMSYLHTYVGTSVDTINFEYVK